MRGLLFLGLQHGFEGRREAEATVWPVGICIALLQGRRQRLDGFVVLGGRGER